MKFFNLVGLLVCVASDRFVQRAIAQAPQEAIFASADSFDLEDIVTERNNIGDEEFFDVDDKNFPSSELDESFGARELQRKKKKRKGDEEFFDVDDMNFLSSELDESFGARELRRKKKKRKNTDKRKKRKVQFPLLNEAGVDTSNLEQTVEDLGLEGPLEQIQSTLGIDTDSGDKKKRKKKGKKKKGKKKENAREPPQEQILTQALDLGQAITDASLGAINAVNDFITSTTGLPLPQFTVEDASESVVEVESATALIEDADEEVSSTSEIDPCKRLRRMRRRERKLQSGKGDSGKGDSGKGSPKASRAPTVKAPSAKSVKAPTAKSVKAPSAKSSRAPTVKSAKSAKAPTVKSGKGMDCFDDDR